MNKYHTLKKRLYILKHAFIKAQQNGWKPVEAPWLPEGVTWNVVAVLDEVSELWVYCTEHKRFHTITSLYQPEEGYVRYLLFQPGFTRALGYTRADLQAWCDKGNDPVEYVAQFLRHKYGHATTS